MRESRTLPPDFPQGTSEATCHALLTSRRLPRHLRTARRFQSRSRRETGVLFAGALPGSNTRVEDLMTEEMRDVPVHVPVMLKEVMNFLSPTVGETFVDGTLGTGGHARAIARALGSTGRLLALDRDPTMLELARGCLDKAIARFVAGNFSELDACLPEFAPAGADGILLDLGVASPQLNDPARGLSYRTDGPLDMRMTSDEGASAEQWVRTVSGPELERVLREYGEERFARRIARRIVSARTRSRIGRTSELAEIIRRAVPPGRRRLHPARRTFQAIRIVINRELDHLDRFLEILPGLLKTGGRCAIISYHSLEDRRVKNAFREGARKGYYEALTRKPLRPAPDEVAANPRSRSAKLRAVRKVKL